MVWTCSICGNSFKKHALKFLLFVFGYGIPLWGCKLPPLYLWSAHQYFRFIFHRMLYSQWKWISYCSRYVYSFEVCPTKCLLYIFGYGFLRWRWKFSRVIWGMCNYIFALLLMTGYIHNVSWFQIGQGMYIRSTYAHSNIQYLLLVMAF